MRFRAESIVLCVSAVAQHRALVASCVSRSESGRLVFAGTKSDEVAKAFRDLLPSVALFSRIPLIHWFRLLRTLENLYGDSRWPKLVLLADNVNSAYVHRVLSYGFDDVVDCRNSNDSLNESLRAAIDVNDRACSSHLSANVDIPYSFRARPIIYSDSVDFQIAGLIAAGYADREIAEVVHYSYQVVRNRISAMLFRSGLRNRTQLAFRYMVEKLCEE